MSDILAALFMALLIIAGVCLAVAAIKVFVSMQPILAVALTIGAVVTVLWHKC